MILHFNHVRFLIVQHVLQKKIACSIVNVVILKPESLPLEMVKTISIGFNFEKEKLSYQKGKNSNPKSHMVLCTVALLGPQKTPENAQLGGWGDIEHLAVVTIFSRKSNPAYIWEAM
jgi:hypothetical protein